MPHQTQASAFRHDDAEKPPVQLVPSLAIEQIAQVLAYGIEKYELADPLPTEQNWMQASSEVDQSRLKASLLRHIYADLRGEKLDPESGLPHIAHAGANVCFLLHHYVQSSAEAWGARVAKEDSDV